MRVGGEGWGEAHRVGERLLAREGVRREERLGLAPLQRAQVALVVEEVDVDLVRVRVREVRVREVRVTVTVTVRARLRLRRGR